MKEKMRKGVVGEAAHGKNKSWAVWVFGGEVLADPKKQKALERAEKRRRCGQLEAHFWHSTMWSALGNCCLSNVQLVT